MGRLARFLGLEPELPPAERSQTIADIDALFERGPFMPSGTGLEVSATSAMTSAAVYACVNVLAQDIASLPLITYRRLPNGGKERAFEHPLYDILHELPNPEMTSYELRSCLVGHQALWGNAYCEIERSDTRINGLWPLRPDRMTVQRDTAGELVYSYRLPDGQPKVFAFADIMHWRGLSSNGILGYSPIQQAAESVGVDLATRQYGARFFGNDSRPGGVLKHPGKLSREGSERLKTSWENAHRGLNNAQRVAVLEEGIEWQQIGIPPDEAQFLETRKYTRTEIAALYRIAPHKIGDLERATFSNIEEQNIDHWQSAIRPWLVQIEQSLRRDLFQISAGKRTHFAEHMIEGLLRGNSEGRAAYLQTMRQNGVINADEWRAMDNLNPIPGGKGAIYWQPANMLELGAKPEPKPAPLPPAEPTAAEDAEATEETDTTEANDETNQPTE
jgi:HK97 family phage portal protein